MDFRGENVGAGLYLLSSNEGRVTLSERYVRFVLSLETTPQKIATVT
jgi:hypothetical protein